MKEGDCFIKNDHNNMIKLIRKANDCCWYFTKLHLINVDEYYQPHHYPRYSEDEIKENYKECDPKYYDKIEKLKSMYEISVKSILKILDL